MVKRKCARYVCSLSCVPRESVQGTFVLSVVCQEKVCKVRLFSQLCVKRKCARYVCSLSCVPRESVQGTFVLSVVCQIV